MAFKKAGKQRTSHVRTFAGYSIDDSAAITRFSKFAINFLPR